MTHTKPNARFWVFVNGGPVKLTLEPEQVLSWRQAWTHEEGWASEDCSWEYAADEDCVYRHWGTDGRDCDGRLSRGGSDHCHLDKLMSGNEPYIEDSDDPSTWEGVVWPAWERFKHESVYDEYAQKAGY